MSGMRVLKMAKVTRCRCEEEWTRLMSIQDVHISTEESRILRVAEQLIAEEMQSVRHELELLRAAMNKSYEIQRRDLQEFYDDTRQIIRRIEQ